MAKYGDFNECPGKIKEKENKQDTNHIVKNKLLSSKSTDKIEG